ncbi:ABC transporter permease [Gammaproteobacteria bacterium]|nr:ABC transporter permease [Gammaproteobacteria bacterium]
MFSQFEPKYNTPFSVISNSVYALVIKNLKSKWGTMSLGFIWIFLEPLLHLAIILTIFGVVFGRLDGGIFTIESLLFTLLNWFLIRDIITININALAANKNYLGFPTLKPILFYLSGYITVVITAFAIQLVFFLLSLIFLENFYFFNVWKLVYIFLFASLFGLFISIVLASLTINRPGLRRLLTLSLRFLYIGSLVIFPIEIIPPLYVDYIFLNPLAQLMEMVREIIFPSRNFGLSPSYIFIWLLALFPFSVLIYQAIGKEID